MSKPTDGKAMKHEGNSLDVFDFFPYNKSKYVFHNYITLFYDSCSGTMVDLQLPIHNPSLAKN